MIKTETRLIMFFAVKNGEALYSQQKQEWELTMVHIMNSLLPNSDLKKVGKTTRPFRYDLNYIPCNCTVEVRNRFKGLDLIDIVPEELWTEVCDIVQETGIKTISKKKKCKIAKWLSGEALQIALQRKEVKSKGEKERYIHLNAEFQRIARRDKKAFLCGQCKEIEENNRMGTTRDLFARHHAINGVLSFTTIQGQLIGFAMSWLSRPQSMFSNTSR